MRFSAHFGCLLASLLAVSFVGCRKPASAQGQDDSGAALAASASSTTLPAIAGSASASSSATSDANDAGPQMRSFASPSASAATSRHGCNADEFFVQLDGKKDQVCAGACVDPKCNCVGGTFVSPDGKLGNRPGDHMFFCPKKTGPTASAARTSTIPVCGEGASLYVNDANKAVCSQHCDTDKDCKGGMKCNGAMGVPADPRTGDPMHPGNAGITPICASSAPK